MVRNYMEFGTLVFTKRLPGETEKDYARDLLHVVSAGILCLETFIP
jgi:hypothetical protein